MCTKEYYLQQNNKFAGQIQIYLYTAHNTYSNTTKKLHEIILFITKLIKVCDFCTINDRDSNKSGAEEGECYKNISVSYSF